MRATQKDTQGWRIRDPWEAPAAAGTGASSEVGRGPGAWLASRRGLAALFLVALVLRLGLLFALGSASRAEQGSTWDWGWETACMAETLLGPEPFGDPWGKDTGASAWLTPVYPAVVAGCMALGGGVTATTALLLFGLHAVFSAATCLLLVGIGRALALGRTGLVAGWVFALYPAALWNAVTNVWDTTLIAFVVAAFFLLLLRAAAAERGAIPTRRAALLGLAYGALLMVNPAPLALLPGALWFVAKGARARLHLPAGLAFLGGAVLVCSPWMVRNALVLGTPNLRSNLGVEFHVGNNDLGNGRHQTAYHPSHSERELALYRELGEVAYAKASLHTALEWMRSHPARTARLMGRRVQIFWVGESPWNDPRTTGGTAAAEDPKAWIKWAFHLASGLLALVALALFRRGRPEGLLLRLSLLLFPAPYYLTHVMERYRFPVDPLLVFLDVWMVGVVLRALRRPRS